MTYCSNCGVSLQQGISTCPRCGKTAAVSAGAVVQPQPYQLPHQVYPSQPINPNESTDPMGRSAIPPAQAPYPPQPTYPPYPVNPPRPTPAGTNTYAILGFILCFLPLPFAGIVLCIMGLVQCSKAGQDGQRQKGRGLAIAGIIIRLLGIVVLGIVIATAVWFLEDTGYNYIPEIQDWQSFAVMGLGLG